MGEEIVIELPDSEPENEGEGLEVAEEVIIDELAALREAERERIAADILAAAALAQTAHDLATHAHERIDGHNESHALENLAEIAMAEAEIAVAESEPESEPVVEVEAEPEPEHHEDKKPNREHWFYR